MTRSLDDIDYLTLSAAERLLLVQDILDSVMAEAVVDPLTPEQRAELDRRCVEIESGSVTCLPWEQVRTRFVNGSE